MIQEHNKLYHQGGIDAPEFTKEINQFADLSDEEFIKGYTGVRVPKRLQDKANENKVRGRKLMKILNQLPEWAYHGGDSDKQATPTPEEVSKY
jgi:hypothetical protein